MKFAKVPTKLVLNTIFLLAVTRRGNAFGLDIPSKFQQLNRRDALASLLTTLVTPSISVADDTETNDIPTETVKTADNSDFQVYSIIPDSSAILSPNLVAIEV